MQPKLWYIRGLPLFTDAGDLAERLRTIGRVERWGHRANVILPNDPREVRVVLSGQAELADGRYDALTRLTAGDVFGELRADEAAYTLKAYDDLLIASLPRDLFESETSGALGEFRARVGRLRRLSLAMPVGPLLYTAPQRRLSNVLLHFAESVGAIDGDEGRLGFVPNRRALARLSGLADPTVSDIVDGFRRDQIVKVGRTELVIPSIEQMRKLAIE